MKSLIRQSIRTGVTFGIVHIFFVLIGFNSMIGILIAKLTGVRSPGDIPAPAYMIGYTLLLGVWIGAAALSKKRTLPTGQKFLASSVAGLFMLRVANYVLLLCTYDNIIVMVFSSTPCNSSNSISGERQILYLSMPGF